MLRLVSGQIRFSEQFPPIKFPAKHSLDAVATFSEIFGNGDYYLGDTIVDSVIIDCGANLGLSATYFHFKHPHSPLIALEPSESNYTVLCDNLRRIFPESNFTILNKAVSTDSNGVLGINDKAPSSLMQFRPVEGSGNLRTTPSISLNSLVLEYELESIGILKIDIEGAERYLFDKFETINKACDITKYIIIETHDDFMPNTMELIENKLKSIGFELISRKPHEYAVTTIDKYINKNIAK